MAMRSTRTHIQAAAFLAALVLVASPAAPDDFMGGVRIGHYTNLGKPFVGGELLARIAPHLYFNPNVEVVLVDNGSYLTFNADFHYDFPHRSTFFWLGAGIGVVEDNPDGPDNTHTETVANFLAGVGFRAGRVIPYFQMKVIAKNDSELSLGVGLRF
jgi:hypothetical protein